MNRLADERSIIGIDPSSRGLAFVFFERGTLIDWGIRRIDSNPMRAIDRLAEAYKADVAVIEDPDAGRCERRVRVRRLLREMAVYLRAKGTSVVIVSRYEIRRRSAARGLMTKHALAAEIGRTFPEIEYLVPPPRKAYSSEHGRSDLFDAMSLVLHVFGLQEETMPPQHPTDRMRFAA
jgi:hypothetical protein